MNRPLAWVLGAVLVAIVAAGFIPLSLWSAPLQQALVREVARTASLDVSATGPVKVVALPVPRVIYSNVRIGHPDGTVLVVADRLVADLSLPDLIAGQVEFAGLRLLRPQLSIDTAGSRPEQTAALKRAIQAPKASEEARQADSAKFGGLSIVDGSLRLKTNEDLTIVVEGVNATIDWPNLGATATLSGRAVWRGEKFEVDLLLGKPAEVLRGERSPFTIKLSSRLLDLSADGSISGGARWIVDARMASSSERFAQFLALVDAQPPIPGRLARFGLSGRLRALPNSATLSDVKLSIDGNSFDGSLTLLAGDKRPKISGTLATRNYVLRTRESGLPPVRREQQWSKEGLTIGRLDLLDADLRISAAQASLGHLELKDAGFVIALEDGLLEITTANAEAFGGALRGRWRFNSRAATPELDATGSFRNINIASFLRAIGHANVASGSTSGEFTIQTLGLNVHTMMQNATGSLRANARSVEMMGVDLERALRRTERRPLSIASELRNGQTNFVQAELEAKIEDGVFNIERVIAVGPGAEVSVTGDASLPERLLRLEVTARQPRPAKPAPNAKEAPAIVLDLVGSWERPALFIDPETLIRRSEAAAPLWRRAEPPPPPAIAPPER
jgi:AsmA protein